MIILLVREEHKDLFVYARFELVLQDDKLMIFTKEGREQKTLTCVNLTDKRRKWIMPKGAEGLETKLCIQNDGGSDEELEPIEARVYIYV
jgi:hypothetical protein